MNAVRVPWSHASFLVYLGGITILAAMLAFLSVESGENGAAGLVGWSALVLGVLATLAFLAKRNRRFVTAGLYALSAVAAFVVFFGALLDWFGWLSDTQVGCSPASASGCSCSSSRPLSPQPSRCARSTSRCSFSPLP